MDFAPTFGVLSNKFGFRISWAASASVVVEASTNLTNPVWSPLGTNSLTMGVEPATDGWAYFADPDYTNYPTRFYRIRSP